jgi:hypothetical protein
MNKNKTIPIEDSFAEWRKDPDYVKACYALEDEFSHAADAIKVRVNRRVLDNILCQRADK